MRFFSIVISSFFILCSCSHGDNTIGEYAYEDVYFQDGLKRAFNKNDNSPITGSIIQKNKKGKYIFELPYRNGVLDGYVRIWSDSILEFEAFIKDGREAGVWRFWKDKENIDYEFSYVNGVLDGLFKGENFEESYKAGVKDGLCKEWYENGQLKYEVNFKDGKEEGVAKSFYENGNLESEVLYNEGAQNGNTKRFYSNGKLKSVYVYRDDKKNGLCIDYYENGQVRRKLKYVNGELIGPQKTFFENGELRGERYMVKGKNDFKLYDSIKGLVYYSVNDNKKIVLNKLVMNPPDIVFELQRYNMIGDVKFEEEYFFPWNSSRWEGIDMIEIIVLKRMLEYYESDKMETKNKNIKKKNK